MKYLKKNSQGFSLLEVLIVIALIGVLASIAIPRYVIYKEKARSTACLSNRRHINMDEQRHYLQHHKARLLIDDKYACPSGGIYVWLVTDPENHEYPKVGCSLHLAGISQQAAEVDTGETVLHSGGFGDTVRTGRGWTEDGDVLYTSGYWGHATFGDESWADYTYSVSMRADDKNRVDIFYRMSGTKANSWEDGSGYRLNYNPEVNTFWASIVEEGKGRFVPDSWVKMPDDFGGTDSWHDVSIDVQGTHHTISVDGQVIVEFDDDTYASGNVGVGGRDASFTDPSVRAK